MRKELGVDVHDPAVCVKGGDMAPWHVEGPVRQATQHPGQQQPGSGHVPMGVAQPGSYGAGAHEDPSTTKHRLLPASVASSHLSQSRHGVALS